MTAIWPFAPRTNIVEDLEWLTDVVTCKNAEYRRCLRPIPRIHYKFGYQLEAEEYGVARELARTVGGDPIWVPDWPNASPCPAINAGTVSLPVETVHAQAFKAGRNALVFDHNMWWEEVLISAVGSGTITVSAVQNACTHPWVVPCRLGTFSEAFKYDSGPHARIEATAGFTCVDTEDLLALGPGIAYPTYLTWPVVTDTAELINGVSEATARDVDVVDSLSGPVYNYPILSTAKQTSVVAWTALTADALWNLRLWLHSRRGRWKQFWVPSWSADVTITHDIAGGDTAIEIAAIGFGGRYPNPTDLFIAATEEAGGGGWFVRVTGSTAGSAGKELLTLSESFSGAVSLGVIAKTSKLTLSRLDSDRISIQHIPGRQATIVAAVREVAIYA
jgi:hypothetical protein